MGLMSLIHRLLLKRGTLDDYLPNKDDLGGDRSEIEAAKIEIEGRRKDEEKISREVRGAIKRLNELNRQNHYGESLRRAFGGR